MKRFITILCLTLSALLILDSMNAAQAITMFVIAGEVPGTSTTLSGSTMLTIFTFLIGIVAGRISASILRLVKVGGHNTLSPQL